MIGRASDNIFDPITVDTVSFLTIKCWKLLMPITNVGHNIIRGNMMVCHMDRHPLLLERFITFLNWEKRLEEPLEAYLIPSWSTQPLFYQINTQRISSQKSYFGHKISQGNAIFCHKDRHPLLLECFRTFVRCIMMVGWSSGSIFGPLMVNTVSFLTNKCKFSNRNTYSS